MCRQEAKTFLKQTEEVRELLQQDQKLVACLAPSFPAEFTEIENYKVLVGMIKSLGFDSVVEVAFGADLVAAAYKDLHASNKGKGIISSDCPAIVYYVEHYQPELIDNLAPIVSPMVATARVMRKSMATTFNWYLLALAMPKS